MSEYPVRHNRPVLELYLLQQLSDVRASDRGDVAMTPARQDIDVEDALYLAPGSIVRRVLWDVVAQHPAMMLEDVIGDDAIEAPAIAHPLRLLFGNPRLRFGRFIGFALGL
jgi:hypothetical protein